MTSLGNAFPPSLPCVIQNSERKTSTLRLIMMSQSWWCQRRKVLLDRSRVKPNFWPIIVCQLFCFSE